ncbi:S1 domain-containing RNA-binding protein [Mesobacillus subterraneus]|uniref:S1 domain-containing RNA-binding protein n=1 Tax=Mesobacillus subterraneus TaxID=285983 RepID=UPI002041B7C3|nr:S1 domain-containing RNA-binding protein [Mesobacillus subterraneus]MCM3667094.1 S1 domain-containing RNA-binding protein [Mesobacillus subterraneus]MCM3685888.1 S1 domain-containing RNA-binding protein [Mesobacillus subterraneus]
MSIEVGSKLQGKVTGITNFGAFVELPGGSTGLVHISEVADNYVKDINDHLKVGDQVEVKVINVEKDGKIGLSIKKAVDRPERPERPARPERPDRPDRPDRPYSQRPRGGRPNDNRNVRPENFESKMAKFLKDSEDRLSTLKRATESKRGGRGARRG